LGGLVDDYRTHRRAAPPTKNICARPVGNSPAEFKAQILREVEQTKKVVKERNIEFE